MLMCVTMCFCVCKQFLGKNVSIFDFSAFSGKKVNLVCGVKSKKFTIIFKTIGKKTGKNENSFRQN